MWAFMLAQSLNAGHFVFPETRPCFVWCFPNKHIVYKHLKGNLGDLAGAQDLEHERQAVRQELLRVLVLLDAAEIFEQALDQRPAVLDEACAEGLEPGVQRPGNAWEGQHSDSEYKPTLSRGGPRRSEAGRCEGRQNRPCSHHFMVWLHAESWISGICRQLPNTARECAYWKMAAVWWALNGVCVTLT